MGRTEAPEVAPRKVGPPLLIGIVLLPFIFAWFLLGRGYSKLARAVAFCWLLGVVLVGLLAPDSGKRSEPKLTQPNSSSPVATAAPPILEVTAFELGDAYAANEVAAQKRFGDRTLAVTGTVQQVMLDLSNNPTIVMVGANQFSGVQAPLDKGASDRVAVIEKGQTIRVVCRDVEEVIATPILRDCKL